MLKFRVSGMSCAACSGRVKTAVSSLDGIRLCEVNLLTGTMTVEGGTEAEIIAAVRHAGYDAALDSGAFGKDGINKQISKERKALQEKIAVIQFFQSRRQGGLARSATAIDGDHDPLLLRQQFVNALLYLFYVPFHRHTPSVSPIVPPRPLGYKPQNGTSVHSFPLV